MIQISGTILDPATLLNKYPPTKVNGRIIEILHASPKTYQYDSLKYFEFELALRISIVNASNDLAKSKFAFKVFEKARCNTQYWTLTGAGGFLLKRGVSSYDAIKDIYINSSKYGTECATAVIIVYLKALLDIFPKKLFQKLFPEIYLYSWLHLDSDLGLYQSESPTVYLPGDCRYFNNPDHDPNTPQWQGENAIDLGFDHFYGHGIGIKTEKEIINELNSLRKQNATSAAYLMKFATRMNSKNLAKNYFDYSSRK